ncbi:MAG: hypothetical protein R3C02_04795 [Planctomycetaceae bacterium]
MDRTADREAGERASLEGVDELAAFVNEKQVPTAVAYTLRAHPALIAVKAVLDEQRYGRVGGVVVSGQHFPF